MILWLLLITAIWGGTFVTVKDALGSSDTFTFLALRFALGGAAGLLLARSQLRDLRVWRLGFGLGLLLFGGYALQTLGLETTTPARSAFITGLSVLFVPFVQWAINRVAPTLPTLVGVGLALAGLQMLTGFTPGSTLPIGDLLTLGCAIVYAGHIVATGHLGAGVSPIALVTVQLWVTAAFAAGVRPLVVTHFTPTPTYWVAIALTGVLASTFAIAIQIWAQARVPAERAAVIYSLEPAFAVIFGLALGHGMPKANELSGGALLVAAVLVSEIGAMRRRRLSSTPA